MRFARPVVLLVTLVVASVIHPVSAAARGPRNPYSSFNLSGVNYGAQQWERAQRQGRRVWPFFNTPGRTSGLSRAGAIGVGGLGGQGGGFGGSGIVLGGGRRGAGGVVFGGR